MSRHDDDIATDASGDDFELFPLASGMCDSCMCCTAADCVPSMCGEDDYGRFHCPCTSE